MSLALAAVGSKRAYIASDGRATFTLFGRRLASRECEPKFVVLKSKRLVMATTGLTCETDQFEASVCHFVDNFAGDPKDLFEATRQFIDEDMPKHSYGRSLFQRLVFLIREFRHRSARPEYGCFLVGWDEGCQNVRSAMWAKNQHGRQDFTPARGHITLLALGKTAGAKEILHGLLAKGTPPFPALELTIRTVASKDADVGGEVYTSFVEAPAPMKRH
jgi:hypothetical protein